MGAGVIIGWKISLTHFEQCDDVMKIVSFIENDVTVKKILTCYGRWIDVMKGQWAFGP